MKRKERKYPPFEKFTKRKQGGDIADCSIASLHFFVAQNKLQTSNFIVTDKISRFSGSSFYPFDKDGYQSAISLYEKLITEYLDKIEQEFYE